MAIQIKQMTDGLGADVCIDAVGCEAAGNFAQTLTGVKLKLQAGAATALHWAINSVRKGGVVSIVGVYGPTFNAVPIGNAINKGLTLRMNQASVKRHLPRLIEHVFGRSRAPERDHHPPRAARGSCRGVPHLLEQARQLHQDRTHPATRADITLTGLQGPGGHRMESTARDRIEGWGADLDPRDRPAHPKERTPPRLDNVPWDEPEQQARSVEVFVSTERPGITPVFGTSVPPAGLSGALRRRAFRRSENDIRHWLMLLLADRVNVVEGLVEDARKAPRSKQLLAGAVVVGALAYLWLRPSRGSVPRRRR